MNLATLLHLKLQYLSNTLYTYVEIYVGILLKEERAFYLILDGLSFHLFYCLRVFASEVGKTPGRWWAVILLFCGLLLPSTVMCFTQVISGKLTSVRLRKASGINNKEL